MQTDAAHNGIEASLEQLHRNHRKTVFLASMFVNQQELKTPPKNWNF